MGRSNRVTAAHRRAIGRLVAECRDRGDHAGAWQEHLIAGLVGLTGGQTVFTGAAPVDPTPAELARFSESAVAGGWESAAKLAEARRWMTDPAVLAHHPAVGPFLAEPGAVIARTRPELVADAAWAGSAFVNERIRALGFDEGLLARAAAPAAGATYFVTIARPVGERAFAVRDGKIVEVALAALAPHLGRSLWLTTQPSRHGLTPRLGQVLDCLLDGDAEKQAAARLGLRPSTVHDYVKRLYHHFEVSSRAELLAYFLKRYRG